MKTYNRRKSMGQCPLCGKDNCPSTCDDCKVKTRAYQNKWVMNMSEERYKEYVDNKAFSTMKRQKYLKSNNLCVNCGKVKPREGVRCSRCRILHNSRNRKYWRENNE